MVKKPAISLLFSPSALCAWLTLHKLLREHFITLKRSNCKWQLNTLKPSYQILVKNSLGIKKKKCKKASLKLCIEKPVCRRHAHFGLACVCVGSPIVYALVLVAVHNWNKYWILIRLLKRFLLLKLQRCMVVFRFHGESGTEIALHSYFSRSRYRNTRSIF